MMQVVVLRAEKRRNVDLVILCAVEVTSCLYNLSEEFSTATLRHCSCMRRYSSCRHDNTHRQYVILARPFMCMHAMPLCECSVLVRMAYAFVSERASFVQ